VICYALQNTQGPSSRIRTISSVRAFGLRATKGVQRRLEKPSRHHQTPVECWSVGCPVYLLDCFPRRCRRRYLLNRCYATLSQALAMEFSFIALVGLVTAKTVSKPIPSKNPWPSRILARSIRFVAPIASIVEVSAAVASVINFIHIEAFPHPNVSHSKLAHEVNIIRRCQNLTDAAELFPFSCHSLKDYTRFITQISESGIVVSNCTDMYVIHINLGVHEISGHQLVWKIKLLSSKRFRHYGILFACIVR